MCCGEVDPVRGEPGQVVVREHVLQPRKLLRERLDLRELLGVLAEDPHSLGVLDHVGDVLRGAVGVHRDAYRSDLREREVHERPVEAVLREDRERVAFRDPACEQPVRVPAHQLVGVLPRDLAPPFLAVVLDEIRRRGTPGGDGVAPETRDRPPAARWRGLRRRRRSLRHPLILLRGVRRRAANSLFPIVPGGPGTYT